MSVEYYKQYEPIFGEWYIKREIYQTSHGYVFEITRQELGETHRAMLKVLTISKNDINEESPGVSIEHTEASYQGVLNKIKNELSMIKDLDGRFNITRYEDYCIIEHINQEKHDVLIRMKWYTPFHEYCEVNNFMEKDAVKLGTDICVALSYYESIGKTHSEVVPENIYVDDKEMFKLAPSFTMLNRKKPSMDYLPPEVCRGGNVDNKSDLYSLGLILYRLLNEGRLPFWPLPPSPVRFVDRRIAIENRLQAVTLPKPSASSNKMTEIILRACDYEPSKRFSSADEMRRAFNTENNCEEAEDRREIARIVHKDGHIMSEIDHVFYEKNDECFQCANCGTIYFGIPRKCMKCNGQIMDDSFFSDPVEWTEEYAFVIGKINKRVEKKYTKKKQRRGLCHEIWEYKAKLLSKEGIIWKSPARMCPHIRFF